MLIETRRAFLNYTTAIAAANGISVAEVGTKFTVAPTPAQEIIKVTQEKSEFLNQMVDIRRVTKGEGETLGMRATSRIASRTKTQGVDKQARQTKDPTGLNKIIYKTAQTNFDVGLPYDTIDMWRHDPNFQKYWGELVAETMALDRLCIGWNGTSVADTTDPETNPLLEDVNKGWLKCLEENKPERYVKHASKVGATTIKIGDGVATDEGFITLDALVWSLLHALEPHKRKQPGMVAIISDNLATTNYFPLINRSMNPTEWLARDIIMSNGNLGGIPAMAVPFVPDGTVIVTTAKNLAIYIHEGTERRMVQDRPEWDEVADWNSANEAYTINDIDSIAAATNIEYVDA